MIAGTATRRGMTVPTSTKAVGLLNQQTETAVMVAAGFDSTVRPTSALSQTIPDEITVRVLGFRITSLRFTKSRSRPQGGAGISAPFTS
jgi:hypothetical protein